MLEITESAVKQFKKVLLDAGVKDFGIRIFSSGGGCCGPAYGMDASETGEAGDTVIEKDGLKIFVESESFKKLSTALVDYSDSPGKVGFVLTGLPTSSCCG